MGVNTERLAYRFFTESDNWSAVVDKLNYNFDQNKAFGGGDPGDRGFQGFRGLPGATGIGKKGDTGDTGATIAFVQVALSDGQAVTDPELRPGDVVIDSNGAFYSIITNNVGNPVFKFEYSLSAAVAGSIVQTENQVVSQSTNPIIKWFLRTTGNPKDANALFVNRVIGSVTDEAQLYRVIVGDAGYPLLQNASVAIVNILPDAVVTSAKDNFFAQLAFKYRSASNSNVSSNTGYLRYFELNKNETTPAGADDTYMSMENISAGFGAVHDSVSTDASFALIRGNNVRFTGKTSIDQLYNNGSINNANQYAEIVFSPSEVRFRAPNLFRIQATAGELALSATTLMSFASPKNFFQNALYVGTTNYNTANTYAPDGGAVFGGAVGIGVSYAPYVDNGVKLEVNGGIKVSKFSAIIWDVGGPTNIDHIWVDDINYKNVNAVFNFVGGAGYKSTGSAGIRAGAILTERAEFYDRVVIGDNNWSGGFAKGLSVQGRTELNDITEVYGKLWGYGGAEFNGVVAMETTNFYTRVGSQVDLRQGDALYLGAAGINFSVWRYWNTTVGGYEYLGYRGDVNDWRVSWGGIERKLWHGGNQGHGSGMDADLLDGYHGTSYWRKDTADTGNFMQFRGQDINGAIQIHQDNVVATQIQRWYFGNTLVAYCQVDGVQYATDFYILSDKKLKKNIRPLGEAWDVISKLKPVNFEWKTGDGIAKSGFIAQDVQKVLPDMVKQGEMGLSMSNSDLIPYLVKGLQEAFAEIGKLRKMLNK